jgi:hypothetical protein
MFFELHFQQCYFLIFVDFLKPVQYLNLFSSTVEVARGKSTVRNTWPKDHLKNKYNYILSDFRRSNQWDLKEL